MTDGVPAGGIPPGSPEIVAWSGAGTFGADPDGAPPGALPAVQAENSIATNEPVLQTV